MQTGESEESLRKILDMTRLISVVLLILHFYYFCYRAFEKWHLTLAFTDRLMANVRSTGLFNSFYSSKLFALVFLFISLLGAKRKNESQTE